MKRLLVLVLLFSLLVNAQTEWREQEIKQLDYCYDYAKVKVETQVSPNNYKIEDCNYNGHWWDCQCDKNKKIINLLYLPDTKGIFNYKVEYNVQELVPEDPVNNANAKRNINIQNQQVGYVTFDPVVKQEAQSDFDSNTLLIVIIVILTVTGLILGAGVWYLKKLWSESDNA